MTDLELENALHTLKGQLQAQQQWLETLTSMMPNAVLMALESEARYQAQIIASRQERDPAHRQWEMASRSINPPTETPVITLVTNAEMAFFNQIRAFIIEEINNRDERNFEPAFIAQTQAADQWEVEQRERLEIAPNPALSE